MRRRRIFGLCVKWAGGTTMRMTPTDQWPRRAQRGRRCMWSGGAWYHQINKWIGSRALARGRGGARRRARRRASGAAAHVRTRANAPMAPGGARPTRASTKQKKSIERPSKRKTPHRIASSHRSLMTDRLIDHHHRSIECLIPHTYSYSMYKPGRLTASCSVSVSA